MKKLLPLVFFAMSSFATAAPGTPLPPQTLWSCDITGGHGSAESVDIVMNKGHVYGSITYSSVPDDEAVFSVRVTSKEENGTVNFISKNPKTFSLIIHLPAGAKIQNGESAKAQVKGHLPGSNGEPAENYALQLNCVFQGTGNAPNI